MIGQQIENFLREKIWTAFGDEIGGKSLLLMDNDVFGWEIQESCYTMSSKL